MINIVMPMSGAGKRFTEQGYEIPKPLIPVGNLPTFQFSSKSLYIEANRIFIVRQDHINDFGIENDITSFYPNAKIIATDTITQGPLCSVLLAREHINNHNPLFIINCDNYIEFNVEDFLSKVKGYNGGIITYPTDELEPKYSYVKIDDDNTVINIREKKKISDLMCAGIYYFARGEDFINHADEIIADNDTVNNEYYVSSVYKSMIANSEYILNYTCDKLLTFGTPEELEQTSKVLNAKD